MCSLSLRRPGVKWFVEQHRDNGETWRDRERQGETMLTQVLIVHLRLDISDVRAEFTYVTL